MATQNSPPLSKKPYISLMFCPTDPITLIKMQILLPMDESLPLFLAETRLNTDIQTYMASCHVSSYCTGGIKDTAGFGCSELKDACNGRKGK